MSVSELTRQLVRKRLTFARTLFIHDPIGSVSRSITMLKSYEAIYENGQVKWLAEQPEVNSARIIVTVLEEKPSPAPAKRRSSPVSIAGKGKTLGDIVSPIVDEQDWECLK